jgi:predicted nucleic acid-binding protein
LDTSTILAHHLAESGAERVQALFDDESTVIGICVVSLMEFESRLRAMGLDEAGCHAEIQKYRLVIDEIVPVDERVCARAAELKFSSGTRLPNLDALIAATA